VTQAGSSMSDVEFFSSASASATYDRLNSVIHFVRIEFLRPAACTRSILSGITRGMLSSVTRGVLFLMSTFVVHKGWSRGGISEGWLHRCRSGLSRVCTDCSLSRMYDDCTMNVGRNSNGDGYKAED